MLIYRLFALFIILYSAMIPQAIAQNKSLAGIVATVNEEAITAIDLDARIKIALVSSQLPNTAEVRRNLVSQVLRALIDEKLKLQEAEKYNIQVTEEEVNRQLDIVAQRNNGSLEKFLITLKENDIPLSAVKEQIESELAWNRFVRQELRRRVSLLQSEIQATLHHMEMTASSEQYRIAEIFLNVPSFDQEDEIKKLAHTLVEQIQNGTPFPPLARQFSDAASAATNGDLGWIQKGSLSEPILNQAIQSMTKGQVSSPIRGQNGFYIFYMIDQKDSSKIEKSDVLLNIKKIHGEKSENLEQAAKVIKGCFSMEEKYRDFLSPLTGDINNISENNLSFDLKKRLRDLQIGELSPVFQENGGYSMIMICRKKHIKNINIPTEEQISESIIADQLNLLQQQYLQSLRKESFIDVRLF